MLIHKILIDTLQSKGADLSLLPDRQPEDYSWSELMLIHPHAARTVADLLGGRYCGSVKEFDTEYTPQLAPSHNESDFDYDERLAVYSDHGFVPAIDQSGQKVIVCVNPFDPVLDSESGSVLVVAAASVIETILRGTRNSLVAPYSDDEPIETWINRLFKAAHERMAADIEITSMQSDMRVRFKVNGRWIPWISALPLTQRGALLRSLCAGASPSIDYEPGADHDFKVERRINGIDTSWRGAITPAALGDSVTLRSLAQIGRIPTLEDLGYNEQACALLRKTQNLRDGLVLVTGPTGSGKTTTLYSVITELRDTHKKIFTVEHPVEVVIPGVIQKPVSDDESIDSKYRVTFAGGLRTAMRHAPDVLVVGESRDNETANASVSASRSGHLTYTTLHTSTILTSVKRMIDLGVSPVNLADTLMLVVSQNLVRKLCPYCRIEHANGGASRNDKGCQACNYTGEMGRTVVYEIASLDDEAREGVIDGSLRHHLPRLQSIGRYIDKRSTAQHLLDIGTVDRREVESFLHV